MQNDLPKQNRQMRITRATDIFFDFIYYSWINKLTKLVHFTWDRMQKPLQCRFFTWAMLMQYLQIGGLNFEKKRKSRNWTVFSHKCIYIFYFFWFLNGKQFLTMFNIFFVFEENARRTFWNSLFHWPPNPFWVEKIGSWGDGGFDECDPGGVGREEPFLVWKKMFLQKYCIRSVSAHLAWRSLKTITETCVLGRLQKWIRLRRKAPICYIYSAFVKTFFSNSKTEVPIQIHTKRNSKVRGSKKHYKNSAFSNYVFGNSNWGGASTRVFS